MTEVNIKPEYAKLREEAIKKWKNMPKEAQDLWWDKIYEYTSGWVAWWDTVKEIEKKFHIDPWGIARDVRYNWGLKLGQNLAKTTKEHGLRDLYTSFWGQFEITYDMEVIEFTDEVLNIYVHKCPFKDQLKEYFGKTEEEVNAAGCIGCISDPGTYKGFNPEFTVFEQPCSIMRGDDYCIHRVEHHQHK